MHTKSHSNLPETKQFVPQALWHKTTNLLYTDTVSYMPLHYRTKLAKFRSNTFSHHSYCYHFSYTDPLQQLCSWFFFLSLPKILLLQQTYQTTLPRADYQASQVRSLLSKFRTKLAISFYSCTLCCQSSLYWFPGKWTSSLNRQATKWLCRQQTVCV